MIEGNAVYCDCCGNMKMAEIVGDNLVIKDRRHGKIHIAIIEISDILDKLQKRHDNLIKASADLVTAKH